MPTALEVMNDMIDTLAGEHVDIPETMVPALLVLSGYISDLGGDIGAAVDSWLTSHPEATTTVQDGSITKKKLSSDLLASLTNTQVDALFD